MADPNNEIKQPVDEDQPLPPDYNQPPVDYNPPADNYAPPPADNYAPPPAVNYAPPPATMNPIAAQPTSMSPYPGLVMPARPYGAPHQGIAGIPMLSHLDQNALLPGQVAMLEALGAKQQVQWMMPPPASPGCPPGLECFTELDQISLAQQHNLVECKINRCIDVKIFLLPYTCQRPRLKVVINKSRD